MSDSPTSSDILKQAVSDLIKAAAVEETVLSNILDLENGIIQKAKHDSANLDEFVSVNESVNGILRNVARIQMMIQSKLQSINELVQKIQEIDLEDAKE